MSEYPQYPADQGGNPYGQSAAPTSVRPPSVELAVKLIYANIALALVSSVLTFIYLDDIIDTQLENAGLAGTGMEADAARTGGIVGVVIGLVIGVGLYLLLAVFINKGANWARIVFTVLAVISVLTSLFGITSQPVALLLLSVVGLLLVTGTVVLLFRADSNAYFASR